MAFTTHAYAHDPKHESYGLEAAEALGLDPATVFKTLVADVDGKLTVAIVPVEHQLDLKALARAVNGKKAQMADVKHAERTTGYVAGGISPLGQKKPLPTVLDESALAHATIHVSAAAAGSRSSSPRTTCSADAASRADRRPGRRRSAEAPGAEPQDLGGVVLGDELRARSGSARPRAGRRRSGRARPAASPAGSPAGRAAGRRRTASCRRAPPRARRARGRRSRA